MKIAADTNCFHQVYTEFETVKILAEAGFDAVDYSPMNTPYFNGEKSYAERKNYFEELKKYAEEQGLSFNQSHAPCPSSTEDDAETELIFQNIVRSMQNAAWL